MLTAQEEVLIPALELGDFSAILSEEIVSMEILKFLKKKNIIFRDH